MNIIEITLDRTTQQVYHVLVGSEHLIRKIIMKKLTIKQTTIDCENGSETIFEANGCSIVHALYIKGETYDTSGFKVVSFVADDAGKVVDSGYNIADARRKARAYTKANYQRHIEGCKKRIATVSINYPNIDHSSEIRNLSQITGIRVETLTNEINVLMNK